MGIDFVLENFVVMWDATVKKNINKTKEVKRLEKKLKCEKGKLLRNIKVSNQEIKILKWKEEMLLDKISPNK